MNAKIALAAGLALCGSVHAQTPAPAGKPSMPPICGSCHKPAPGNMQGYFDNVTFISRRRATPATACSTLPLAPRSCRGRPVCRFL